MEPNINQIIHLWVQLCSTNNSNFLTGFITSSITQFCLYLPPLLNYNRNMKENRSGFTIVEILIVIVVIGILASITIVAYNGIQAKANDGKRMQDAANIQKALASYKAINGDYPLQLPNPGDSTWEISSDPNFLNSLSSVASGLSSIKDPKNPTNWYWYHKFSAGNYGCPASLGNYYVLWINSMQTQSIGRILTNGCTSQTLFTASQVADPSYYAYFGF